MMSQVGEKISVKTPEGEYPIFLGKGLLDLDPLPALAAQVRASAVCAVITNPTILSHHATRVIDSLRAKNFQPCVIEIPDGEQYKTLDTVRKIYDQLLGAQLDRRSIIFALGGGVVGDVAGFAAATFLRGVPFVQLPTTLLAMVDSSVGGKVGVDHPRGKNLIGAFKQPLAVIADTDTLATLPIEEFRCGMAEAVKHGIVGDAELFERLEKSKNWRAGVEDWLPRAIRVKADVVGRDPVEQGDRAKLNLGHTFGHAIEKVSDYRVRHGEGVAIGLVCASRLAARRGLCDAALGLRIEHLLRSIGLPTRIPRELATDAIIAAMQTDKKRVNAQLRFILPRAIGDVVIVDDVAREDVIATIEGARS